MLSVHPRISVVMTVYNGSAYLKEAIDSILSQSVHDFEFLIVDDASTDESYNILCSYSDPRIHIIRNEENIGLAASLNKAIKQAKGEYIARMDSDDIALPSRIALQRDFLDTHPEISILGSDAWLINEQGEHVKLYGTLHSHTLMKWRALFSTPLVHPAVMARQSALLANPYDESYRNSQDYELWSRILFTSDVQFANLPIPLLLYRLHPKSTSSQRTAVQKERSTQTMLRNVRHYTDITESELQAMRGIRNREYISHRIAHSFFQFNVRLVRSFIKQEHTTLSDRLELYNHLLHLPLYFWKQRIRYLLIAAKTALHS